MSKEVPDPKPIRRKSKEHIMDKPLPSVRRRSRDLAVAAKDRAAIFQKMAKDHAERQLDNPFSDHHPDGKVRMKKIDKNDPNYGKPLEGSSTARRGQEADVHIKKEIQQLCEIIYDIALHDPNVPGPDCWVKFGPLFEHYNHVSDKVVGILLRARKYGYVAFEGEMLYQRRDDHVKITLTREGLILIKKIPSSS
ncbi:actin-binding Rho-activating protein-like [Paramacrobiotus metropolitanus]|uniref:actin-binding Rho-activating protein-like n=1 Tax=Paramacrobiotus metropolitanus TaxID=2943436 RepID=UPI00244630D3|nr:actin-binding Rho-activating protein-like [Paramacrobiotus metropolitanus]